MSYFARISTRDGAHSIAACIESLARQTVQPERIIVVDDGSTDGTAEIIELCQSRYPGLIDVISTGSKTRDYRRLPHLLNISIQYAKSVGLWGCKYFFSTGGDCVYARDYVEKVMAEMESDPELVLATGDYGEMKARTPQGTGRVVRRSWFDANYPCGYPEQLGYETEILERALWQGKHLAVVKGATFEHQDKLGKFHGFREWGAAMRVLGYSPFYVLVRCARDALNNTDMGVSGAARMLYHYIVFRPESEGYYSMHDPALRAAIRKRQNGQIARGIKRRIIFKHV